MASSSATVPATDGPFTSVPGPWTCKGECFWLFGYTRTSEPRPGPPAFSPLEGASQFADPARSGEYKGGLTSVMIARYTDSPVGESWRSNAVPLLKADRTRTWYVRSV